MDDSIVRDVLAVSKSGTEKTMTVREIADAMGVSVKAVERCIRRIMPDKIQQGKTTLLNE